jgi:DNA-binding NtrC family response regulator
MPDQTRIFVLDDELNITRTWELILTKAGYHITGFNNPLAALEAIRQNPPDVLLSDVGLPGMNGVELAIKLIEEKIPTKVVLISGQAETENDVNNAAERGFLFDILPKPLGPARLLQVIEELRDGKTSQ